MEDVSSKSKITRAAVTVFLGVLYIGCDADTTEEDVRSKQSYALILGQATVQQSIDIELGESRNGGDVLQSEAFDVDVDEIQVVHGRVDRDSLSLQLFASHASSIPSEEKIFVIIRIADDIIEAVYWGIPLQVACIPTDIVDELDLDRDIPMMLRGDSELCTNTKWFN